ncbi:protein NO VEIN domain-containing protein [Streptomyces sp. NPDC006703]|uniref:protein NO VEIN domain-containing protein n=1 Tax=Streptomyces sp. NPDC006703 TaxID=3364759 RepID=UPI0036C20DA3
MELLHHPELADTLRMALLDLNAAGWGPGQSPDADAIADVLGEDRARVREIAATLWQLLDILVPLLATLDLEAAHALLSDDEAPASETELGRRLAVRLTPTGHQALRTAARHPNLDTARRVMSLSLPELNAAITALGPTHQPLRNAEGIEQEFRHFVVGRRQGILGALRAGFLEAYRSGAPLTAYAENRHLTGLMPDAAWADHHFHLENALMQAHVDHWLTGLGASPLGTDAGLMPVDELRLTNRPLLMDRLKRARTLIHVWEAMHDEPASGLPGDPESLAAEAAAAGLLGFLPLEDATTLRWLRAEDRWLAAVPLALTPEELGLTPGQLKVAALAWLMNRYDTVEDSAWVSGYRNKVLGDGIGDDSLGYDLVVERKRSSLLFEVKSSAGGEGEFVLTPTEIARARSLKQRQTFHVHSHALDADLRKIYLLPNPLHPRSAYFFRSVGEGLRYRFQLSRPGECRAGTGPK